MAHSGAHRQNHNVDKDCAQAWKQIDKDALSVRYIEIFQEMKQILEM